MYVCYAVISTIIWKSITNDKSQNEVSVVVDDVIYEKSYQGTILSFFASINKLDFYSERYFLS